jgi:hypothetical protein
MESSQRGALALVRLVAVCIILVGVLDAGAYLTQYVTPIFEQTHHVQDSPPPVRLNFFRLSLDAIPLVAGIVMLVKSKAVAEWLSDMIE